MRTACLVAVAVLLWQATPGQSQPYGGPPLHVLVGQRSVQTELQLDAGQLRELMLTAARQHAATEQLFALPMDQRIPKYDALVLEGDRTVMGTLRPAQKHRLRQIQWQLGGCRAFTNPEVVEEVGLTADQQFEVAAILDSLRGPANEILVPPNGARPNPDLARRRLTELERPSLARIHRLLSPEQKAKWQEVLGRPFTGELRYSQLRGRR